MISRQTIAKSFILYRDKRNQMRMQTRWKFQSRCSARRGAQASSHREFAWRICIPSFVCEVEYRGRTSRDMGRNHRSLREFHEEESQKQATGVQEYAENPRSDSQPGRHAIYASHAVRSERRYERCKRSWVQLFIHRSVEASATLPRSCTSRCAGTASDTLPDECKRSAKHFHRLRIRPE